MTLQNFICIQNVLIVYMYSEKIFFFKGWYEMIVKGVDAQGGITNNNFNSVKYSQTLLQGRDLFI